MARKSKPVKSPAPVEVPAPPTSRRRVIIAAVLAISFVAAIWLRPDATLAYWWGKSLSASDPAQAEELFLWSIFARGGRYPAAQLAWAKMLAEQGQLTESLGCFGRIEDASACDPAELLLLAQIAERAHFAVLSERALDAANRPGPQRAEVLKHLVKFKVRSRAWPEARQVAEEMARLNPQDAAPWDIIARIHLVNRDVTRAAADFRTALTLEASPDDADRTRLELLRLLIRLGDRDEAREHFDKLTTTGQQTPAARLQDAWLCRLEGRQEQALQIAEAVATADLKSPPARLARGVMLLDAGKLDAALSDLEWVVRVSPDDLEARYKLAVALQQAGRTREAAEHMQRTRDAEVARLKRLNSTH